MINNPLTNPGDILLVKLHFTWWIVGEIMPTKSLAYTTNEDLRPRSYEDGNQVFDSRMSRTDFSIYEQLHQEYMDSQHAGNGEITDFTYENGEFSFRSGEMSMKDSLNP
jgi:hypothetical protein